MTTHPRHFCGKYLLLLLIILYSCSDRYPKSITILATTDVHGEIFPYNFIEKSESGASLASAASYLKLLGDNGTEVLLLDNGDNLQGQPTEYYYNFIDTASPHINPLVMNYMGYDAGTVGNHDIEAGHQVYDRLKDQYDFPLLAANAVDTRTGEPYFTPYTIINKNGIRIAILGLITPSIPNWLPPILYNGIEFKDMLVSAQKWMPEILGKKPDIVVGLFHSGWDGPDGFDSIKSYMSENGSASVAYNVPGFDIIFNGHDHRLVNEKIINRAGDTVLILDGGSRAQYIARADISVYRDGKNGKKVKNISGSLISMEAYPPDPSFQENFSGNQRLIREYVDRIIGEASETISSREAYFGPSAFMNLIHEVQMDVSGADISFAAPLSFDVRINKGPVTVSDMFKLYRYENMLYLIRLTGAEVVRYLEYSYEGWLNTVENTSDNLLVFRTDSKGDPLLKGGRASLKNAPYNFDSAFGINYTVDITKPAGQRISVLSMSDGSPFENDKWYRIAVNSYRASGGGGHLTEGAGLSAQELKGRFISATSLDLRYHIMKYIEKSNIIVPEIVDNWRMIPVKLAGSLKKRDYLLLFGGAENLN